MSVAIINFGAHSMAAESLLFIVGYQILGLGFLATLAGDPIHKPTDFVTNWLTTNLTLERAAQRLGSGSHSVGLPIPRICSLTSRRQSPRAYRK